MGYRPHPPKSHHRTPTPAWTMGISRHAMGNWMGTRRVSRDSMGCFFFIFLFSPLRFFPGSPPPPSLLKAPSFRETGVWEGVPLPGRRQGRGVTSLSLFFPPLLALLVRLFFAFFFLLFVPGRIADAWEARGGGSPAWGETAQMQVKRVSGGAILCHIGYSQSSSMSSHMALAETQRMQF